MSKIIVNTPDDFENYVRQDPDFAAQYANVIFLLALEKGADLTTHLLTNYFEHLDMKDAWECICQRGLVDVYHRLEPYLTDVNTMLKDSAIGEGLVLKAVLETKEIKPNLLNETFKDYCDWGNGANFPALYRVFIDKGADVKVLNQDAAYNLLPMRPELADDVEFRTLFSPFMDEVMVLAMRFHRHELIDLLNDKFADDIKNPSAHLTDVLAKENSLNFLALWKHEKYHFQDILVNYLVEKADQRASYHFYSEVVAAAKPEAVTNAFIEKLAAGKAEGHAWSGLDQLLEKGLDLKAFPAARRLLPLALKRYCGPKIINPILELDNLTDIDESASLALLRGDPDILAGLFEKHGARAAKIDWGYVIKQCADKSLENFQKLQPAFEYVAEQLRQEQQEADARCLEFLQDRTRQKGFEKNELLQIIAPSQYFVDVLLWLKKEAGIRFTAEELSESGALDLVVGFRRYKEFLNHSHWKENLSMLEEVYSKMPDFVRTELGENFVAETQRRTALSKAAKKPPRPPRRR